MLNTRKSKIFFFFSIFSIFLIVSISAFSLSPTGNLYITSGDVIKNFKFDSFDNSPISTGYITDKYGNKLTFGTGPYWRIDPESVQMQYFHQEGDIVYFKYDVVARNTINIYTNCKLSDVAESLTPIKETFLASQYRHLALNGQTRYHWEGTLDWNHYDFFTTSDLRSYNFQNNYFAGDLLMSFDIDSTPIPSSVIDSNGNQATERFSHISVVSVYTTQSTHGFLSDETPIITGTTPEKYDPLGYVSNGNAVVDKTQADQIISWNFNPDTRLFSPYISDSFDSAITPQPEYTSLNPRTKSGTALWDPMAENKTATDCQFTYHITSLSPVVKSYAQQLSYTPHTCIAQDTVQWDIYVIIPIPTLKITTNEVTSSRQTQTRDVALQVSNRYIQAGIEAKFSVYSSYQIVALKDMNDNTLGLPAEYFDYLAWTSAVDGFGGAEGQSEVPTIINSSSIMISLVIILIVAVIGLYLFFRLRKKAMPTVNISLNK